MSRLSESKLLPAFAAEKQRSLDPRLEDAVISMKMIPKRFPSDGDEATEIAKKSDINPDVAVIVVEMRSHLVRTRPRHEKVAEGTMNLLASLLAKEIFLNGAIL